jgi:hypothetical protein
MNSPMQRFRRPLALPAWRRWAAAWALVALFGIAFAPSISRALQTERPDGALGLATLCAEGGRPPAPDHTASDAACALCVLAHAAPLTGAPAAAPVALRRLDHVLAAAPLLTGAPAVAAWRLRARGPPSIA